MKKSLLMLSVMAVSAAAFAQGRVWFENDSLHLVYYDNTMGALSGTLVSALNMPPGAQLVADLYLGTSSSSLSLSATTTFGTIPGEWNPTQVPVVGIPGGTPVFTLVQVRDVAFAAPFTWTPQTAPFGDYYGKSVEFECTLGGITYTPITTTWPIPPEPIGGGEMGAIPVGVVPEPAALALVGLGVAGWGLYPRRKGEPNR